MTEAQRNSKDFAEAFNKGFEAGLRQQRKPIVLDIKLSDKTVKQIVLRLDELQKNGRK